MNAFNFLKLPLEIQRAVLEQLTLPELVKKRLVSRALNQLVEDDMRWNRYLKPDVITHKDANETFSALFGDGLEGLTEQGLQLHPLYGPLYQWLKEAVDGCSDIIEKLHFLEKESQHNRDVARIILSSDFFRRFLLHHAKHSLRVAFEIILNSDHKTMLLGFEWLFQSEVWAVFALTPDVDARYIANWTEGSIKSLDVAWLGFNNQRLMALLEAQYSNRFVHLRFNLFSTAKDHKDSVLMLRIAQTFMGKEALLNEINDMGRQGACIIESITDDLGLTNCLYLPDPRASSFIWNKDVVEDIFNQVINLSEEKIMVQENQADITSKSCTCM